MEEIGIDKEFQESEVLWAEDQLVINNDSVPPPPQQDLLPPERKKKKKKKKNSNSSVSLPVNIPCNKNPSSTKNNNSFLHYWDYTERDDQDQDQQGEMVPPHLMMLARRTKDQMAFPVCTGNGRTLKGRDLIRVRDSILRMTGYLEN